MQVSCFYDYTCPYSWRAHRWLRAAQHAGAEILVDWRTFALKEANRQPEDPSAFADPTIRSISLLALALAHAARGVDFPQYHETVFAAMHEETRHLTEEDLLAIAADAGVDIGSFNRTRPEWLASVAAEHHDAHRRRGVFGTPTLAMASGATAFVKLAEAPEADQAVELWKAVCTLTACHPELLEIKCPLP